MLGDPGAGKTTLLRHLAATLAAQADRPWVPLFESLPRLLREGLSLLDRVIRRMEVAGLPASGLKPVLEREGQQGRLLLLLDGLDEVPREDQERAGQLLRDLAALWPASPIVVTSRRIGYRRPGSDYRELALVPLDRERRRDFLARWLGRSTGVRDNARDSGSVRRNSGTSRRDSGSVRRNSGSARRTSGSALTKRTFKRMGWREAPGRARTLARARSKKLARSLGSG